MKRKKVKKEKVKYGAQISKFPSNIWSIGMHFTHGSSETFLLINLFKFFVIIGKFYH